ncbi:hypothetical protein NQ117_02380 [Paenibacillus sp. SC116]|uniref:hypothetical protein n=1 Tax=Paenibacillus sp. SC116 TaxID=2968986 RepID=UPI00215AB7AA|nr:hypothetical protein [Paenibacillus sp. SC116]MCR8842519.1 hypothetical protein [Paenibacillus sp. SC116]
MLQKGMLAGTILAVSLLGTTTVQTSVMHASEKQSHVSSMNQSLSAAHNFTKRYEIPTGGSSPKEQLYLKKGQRVHIQLKGDSAVSFTLSDRNGASIGSYSHSIIYTATEDGNVYTQFHAPFMYEDVLKVTVTYTIQ